MRTGRCQGSYGMGAHACKEKVYHCPCFKCTIVRASKCGRRRVSNFVVTASSVIPESTAGDRDQGGTGQ
eukprot:gene14774-biopygen12658